MEKHKWIFYRIAYKGRNSLLGVNISTTDKTLSQDEVKNCKSILTEKKKQLKYRTSNRLIIDLVQSAIENWFGSNFHFNDIVNLVSNPSYIEFLIEFNAILQREKKLNNRLEFKATTYHKFENDVMDEINNFKG
jgi:hypothetical protein